MQKNLLTILLVWVALLIMPHMGHGQACTPDPSTPAVGVFPSTLPPACPGVPYNAVLTIGIPTDTLGQNITSVVVNNVQDLPPGLTYACEPSNCTFPGGSKGCIVISGTPTMGGTFEIDLDVTVNVFIPLNFVLVDTLTVVVGFDGTPVTTDAACGASDGTATLDMLTGTPPYSFSWSDGQTDSVANNLASGAYTVDVTDANNCTVTFNVAINSSGGTVPIIDLPQSTTGWDGCHDVDGGFIQPNITGGAAPLTYAWASGQATADISGLAAGTYTLTVTGNDGCSSSETFMISAPDPLVLGTTGVQDASCFGETDGEATISPQGGVAPYTFAWSPGGQTVASVDNLAAGSYTITVEDANGCERDVDVTINEPDELVLSVSAVDASGIGASDGSALAAAVGGNGNYSFDWGPAGTGAALNGLSPGSYMVTVTDELGCTASATVEVGPSTSIQLPGAVASFALFPNPNQGQITIDLALEQPAAMQIRLFDLQGRQVMEQAYGEALQHQHLVNLKALPAGTYLLEVIAERAVIRRQVMRR